MQILTEGDIYKDAIGAIIYIPVNMSRFKPTTTLSEADTRLLKVRKPDGSETEWTPEIHDAPGFLRYVSQAGNLDLARKYYVRAYLEFPHGWKGHRETLSFEVFKEWR